MKSYIIRALAAGIVFALVFLILQTLVFGFSPVMVVINIAGGAFFGASLAVFSAVQERRIWKVLPDFKGEPILKHGRCNHLVDREGVGGWLVLTDQRLYFQSHSLNIRNHRLSIQLDSIRRVDLAMTYGIIPNSLEIHTYDGDIERFVMQGRNEWLDAMLEAGMIDTQL